MMGFDPLSLSYPLFPADGADILSVIYLGAKERDGASAGVVQVIFRSRLKRRFLFILDANPPYLSLAAAPLLQN